MNHPTVDSVRTSNPAASTSIESILVGVDRDVVSLNTTRNIGSGSSSVLQQFPRHLFEILERCEALELSDILSWYQQDVETTDDGRLVPAYHGDNAVFRQKTRVWGFRVHDKKRFEELVMPLRFHTRRYKSFQRNLTLYGFRSFAGRKGAYWHPLFVPQRPDLCALIARSRSTSKARTASLDSREEHRRLQLRQEGMTPQSDSTARQPPLPDVGVVPSPHLHTSMGSSSNKQRPGVWEDDADVSFPPSSNALRNLDRELSATYIPCSDDSLSSSVTDECACTLQVPTTYNKAVGEMDSFGATLALSSCEYKSHDYGRVPPLVPFQSSRKTEDTHSSLLLQYAADIVRTWDWTELDADLRQTHHFELDDLSSYLDSPSDSF